MAVDQITPERPEEGRRRPGARPARQGGGRVEPASSNTRGPNGRGLLRTVYFLLLPGRPRARADAGERVRREGKEGGTAGRRNAPRPLGELIADAGGRPKAGPERSIVHRGVSNTRHRRGPSRRGRMPARDAGRSRPALDRARDARRVEPGAAPSTSLKQTEGAPRWNFYEGPPTANGMPGVHHIEAGVFKDLFPRFKTMQGFHVIRKAAGTVTGCPWKSPSRRTRAVGQEGHRDLRRRRVQRAVPRVGAPARQRVRRAHDQHGYWSTCRPATAPSTPVRGVRLVGAQAIYDKACSLGTSGSARTARGAARCFPTVDGAAGRLPGGHRPSVTVRFRVRRPEGANPRLLGAALLVWTMTPWTLVSNTAIAVHPVDYVIGALQRRYRGAVPRGERRGTATRLWSPRRCGRGAWRRLACARHAARQRVARDRYTPPFGMMSIAARTGSSAAPS